MFWLTMHAVQPPHPIISTIHLSGQPSSSVTIAAEPLSTSPHMSVFWAPTSDKERCNVVCLMHDNNERNSKSAKFHGNRPGEPYVLHRSIKFTKTVFLVPSRRTWGGRMIVRLFSPANSGLFSLRMLNTRPKSWTHPSLLLECAIYNANFYNVFIFP